jgi:hypothetical protein
VNDSRLCCWQGKSHLAFLAPAVTGKGLFCEAAVGFLLPEAVGKSKFKRGALDAILATGRVPGSGVGAVGKWPAVATVQNLAEAGHLSTAVVIACLR